MWPFSKKLHKEPSIPPAKYCLGYHAGKVWTRGHDSARLNETRYQIYYYVDDNGKKSVESIPKEFNSHEIISIGSIPTTLEPWLRGVVDTYKGCPIDVPSEYLVARMAKENLVWRDDEWVDKDSAPSVSNKPVVPPTSEPASDEPINTYNVNKDSPVEV